jgi:hypothetical protein
VQLVDLLLQLGDAVVARSGAESTQTGFARLNGIQASLRRSAGAIARRDAMCLRMSATKLPL